MENFAKEDLEKALQAITSMISRSEKVQMKLKEGTPQSSLTRNRLKALNLSFSLIKKELQVDSMEDEFSLEELKKALPPITSTINKCEKVLEKSKEGTSQYTLTSNMLKALYLSSALIMKEINNR
jgi:hypothetical protein